MRCAPFTFHSTAPFLHPAALTVCHAATSMKTHLAYMRGGKVQSLTVDHLYLRFSVSFQLLITPLMTRLLFYNAHRAIVWWRQSQRLGS